jgi:PAS domain S-box-containing protein
VEAEEISAPDPGSDEDHYRTLVQLAPDVIYGVSPAATFTILSPAFTEITGWTTSEWIGRPFAGLVHPDDLPRAMENFQRLMAGQIPGPYELRIRSKSGDYLVGEIRGIPVFDQGEVVGAIGVARDITERVRVERELEESRDQLAVILQNVDDAITVQQPDGRVIYANEAAARINGFSSADELLALPLVQLVARVERFDEAGDRLSPEDLPARKALRGEETGEMVVRFRLLDTDEERWCIVRSHPVFDDHGSIRFAVTVARNISAQKRADQERLDLLRREQEARAAAESAGDRLAFLARASEVLASSLDYETILSNLARLAVPALGDWCTIEIIEEDGSIRRVALTHADPEMEAYAREIEGRYPRDERSSGVLRTGESQLVPEIDEAMLAAAARDAEHLRVLVGLGLRSGISVPLNARDRVLGVLTVLSAESGRRYRPDDLELVEDLGRRAAVAVDNARLYRQAQEALKLREEFLSIASHELKTPLTSLQLQVQILERFVHQRPPAALASERARHILEGADRQIKRMSKLSADLLDVSRIAGGRLGLERSSVDLGELATEVVERFRAETGAVGVTLNLKIQQDVTGQWDAFRLGQVLTNLLSNAIKYGGGNPIDVEVTAAGAKALLVVRDRGIGIAPEHHTRIFDRFERMTSASSYGGLGLGLYITAQIVEAHGGTIRVDSEPGAGSTFTVELPR